MRYRSPTRDTVIGTRASAGEEIGGQAILAEEMCFENVWFFEQHFLTEWAHYSVLEVMLAVLNQHTSKMGWASA